MSKILLLEGKTDVAFIQYLCKHYKITLDDTVQLIDMQGKGGLSKNMLSLEPEFEKGVKVAVVLDADKDFDARVAEIEKILKGYDVAYFLSPNHGDTGDLEKLLLSTIDESNDIVKCFDEYMVCLEEKGINVDPVNDKAKLYAYTSLSCGKKPEDSFDNEIDLWDLENPNFDNIKKFICDFFED